MPIREIHSSKTEFLQILDENSNLDTELEPDLTVDDLMKLYRYMLLARSVDQRQLKLQRQGRIGTFGPCTGQEAVSCGAVLAMRDTDWFVTAFRELGGRLMRGEPIVNSLMLWGGYEEGNYFEQNKRTLPITVVIASQLAPAVGIAYAMRLKGEKDTCVVTMMGDGATSEGDFHEALNFASVWQVPVVFVCQNNQWAISTPSQKQHHAKTYAQLAAGYDMPGIKIDGNDVLAVYKAVKDALNRGRNGEGPGLIECETYRLEMHTTSDDPTRYRSDEEVEEWRKRDSLIRFRKYLETKGILDEEKHAQLESELKAEIDTAVKEYETKTDYKPDAPFDYIFGSPNREIEEQRNDFLTELQKEDSDG